MDVIPNVFHIKNKALSLKQELLNRVNMDDPFTCLRAVCIEIVCNWKPKSKDFDTEVELNRLGEKKVSPRHGFTIFKSIPTETI
jgi:hypothetical protein